MSEWAEPVVSFWVPLGLAFWLWFIKGQPNQRWRWWLPRWFGICFFTSAGNTLARQPGDYVEAVVIGAVVAPVLPVAVAAVRLVVRWVNTRRWKQRRKTTRGQVASKKPCAGN